MKLISKIIFLFSLCKIITTCGIDNPTSADDCKDDTLTQNEKDEDYVHCCFIEVANINENSCDKFTSYQYKNINKYIKKIGEKDSLYGYDIKIDCNSSFLQVCLILVLSFILF